ncbi:MAG: VCBS repeat-containing protein, partial [Candidatus Aminicenantes bacterium]|nr:VCBS repeat-containing protein [Candidatus Aminicenantes bacterium]
MKADRRWGRFLRPGCGVLCFAILLFSAPKPRYTGSVVESFDSLSTMDSTSSVDGWGSGSIRLRSAYGKLTAAAPALFPAWADAATANDFDGDGWQDVIVSGSRYANVLAFAKNKGGGGQARTFEIPANGWLGGCTGSGQNPLTGFGAAGIDASSFVALTSGDYDGDGDFDVFFMSFERSAPFQMERAYLFENKGGLILTLHDVTAAMAGLAAPGGTSRCLVSVDFDDDGDVDVVYGDKDGNVHLLRNIYDAGWGAGMFSYEYGLLLSTGWTTTGIQALAVADVDKNGHLDILVGSRSSPELRLYRNTGEDAYDLAWIETLTGYGVDVILGADFDNDGDAGFLVAATSPAGTGSPSARQIWYYLNDGGALAGKILFSGDVAGCGVGAGANFGAVIDLNRDAIPDAVLGGLNFTTGTAGRFLVENAALGLYNLSGV